GCCVPLCLLPSRPSRSTLVPYTTLFRSDARRAGRDDHLPLVGEAPRARARRGRRRLPHQALYRRRARLAHRRAAALARRRVLERTGAARETAGAGDEPGRAAAAPRVAARWFGPRACASIEPPGTAPAADPPR